MPRGRFTYQTDGGEVARVRLDTAIAALGGAAAGAKTVDFFVQAGGSRRKSTGIRARSVRYDRNAGTADAPSIKSIRVVFFTPTAFGSAPDSVVYKTFTWNQASKFPEDS